MKLRRHEKSLEHNKNYRLSIRNISIDGAPDHGFDDSDELINYFELAIDVDIPELKVLIDCEYCIYLSGEGRHISH